mmetsp:Transcript_24775/g.65031  ORF Transcript_24775/g.65031 Transcript_24775/m.65031 type:complete len:273 (+) Transcript_24775:186-1004(+)
MSTRNCSGSLMSAILLEMPRAADTAFGTYIASAGCNATHTPAPTAATAMTRLSAKKSSLSTMSGFGSSSFEASGIFSSPPSSPRESIGLFRLSQEALHEPGPRQCLQRRSSPQPGEPTLRTPRPSHFEHVPSVGTSSSASSSHSLPFQNNQGGRFTSLSLLMLLLMVLLFRPKRQPRSATLDASDTSLLASLTPLAWLSVLIIVGAASVEVTSVEAPVGVAAVGLTAVGVAAVGLAALGVGAVGLATVGATSAPGFCTIIAYCLLSIGGTLW